MKMKHYLLRFGQTVIECQKYMQKNVVLKTCSNEVQKSLTRTCVVESLFSKVAN